MVGGRNQEEEEGRKESGRKEGSVRAEGRGMLVQVVQGRERSKRETGMEFEFAPATAQGLAPSADVNRSAEWRPAERGAAHGRAEGTASTAYTSPHSLPGAGATMPADAPRSQSLA